jgi:hypothetical protein
VPDAARSLASGAHHTRRVPVRRTAADGAPPRLPLKLFHPLTAVTSGELLECPDGTNPVAHTRGRTSSRVVT